MCQDEAEKDIIKQRLLGMRPKLRITSDDLLGNKTERRYADERHSWGEEVYQDIQDSAEERV